MPPAGRVGDRSKIELDAHGCPSCPHMSLGPGIIGSPTVSINRKPALRVGDQGIHAACCGTNIWTAIEGSGTVLINGQPLHRKGDKGMHCGGIGNLIEGSATVDAGGPSLLTGIDPQLLKILGLILLEALFGKSDMPIPPGVNIDDNIAEAEAHRHGGIPDPRDLLDSIPDPQDLLQKLPGPLGILGDVPSPLDVIRDTSDPLDLYGSAWFFNQVREGGEWDYKRLDPKYENVGNFNYGATGRAMGFSRDELLRAAGTVQILQGNSGEGHPWDSGKSSYGDDPKDQAWIKKGMDYYDNKH